MSESSMGIVAALALSLACASGASAQIKEVDVTGGRVAGVAANRVTSFKGIPFAAPPVGLLRWKTPQPVKSWIGVKQASAFAPACMQDASFPELFGGPPALSEDCLYVNVWTLAKVASDALPVMVWIYGGGFVAGQTSMPAYDGTHLAEQGVVPVSVAYRLGAFEFLAHPKLSRESGKGSDNYGLQDMIAGPEGIVPPSISESGGNFAPPRLASEGGASAQSAGVVRTDIPRQARRHRHEKRSATAG